MTNPLHSVLVLRRVGVSGGAIAVADGQTITS